MKGMKGMKGMEGLTMTEGNGMPRIGWIGAGRMGAALARRLLAAGYQVAVYNRTRAKAEALVEDGATVVDRPVELADRDLVFTMVSASDDLLAVTSGQDGVLRGESAPGVLIDCSTVSAEASSRVRQAGRERGTAFLAAPVSGNPYAVADGLATLAVSGPEGPYANARPVLEQLAAKATHVGEGEEARLVKICHNALLGVLTQSLAEVTVLANKAGISRAAFLEFLNNSVLGSHFTRSKTQALVELDFTPTFTPPLLSKDLELALAAAREFTVPMPVTADAAQLVTSAVGAGYHDEDFAVLVLEQARRSGLTLQPEPRTDEVD
ncbi:NAD(P)-dependent oxidoreductase [Streptomyces sp. WZ-12]|uniref:NAD(P)-dependent oxidoreductase n=1 Tax=Streptomyces sp. WZ-12 TaxID=3030210 RepID=UPI0023815692|nr:NAD(P)-dependent oxidoreductase [Streptomyces sp. WZ-12]